MKLLPLLLVFSLFEPITLLAQSDSKNYNVKSGLAISGYDPVSYFGDKPLKGELTIKHIYLGAKYYFHSAQNLEKFKAAPEKYAPQYGG